MKIKEKVQLKIGKAWLKGLVACGKYGNDEQRAKIGIRLAELGKNFRDQEDPEWRALYLDILAVGAGFALSAMPTEYQDRKIEELKSMI